MAVAAQDRPSLGEIAPQTGRAHDGRITIPMNDHQAATGQGQIEHLGQPEGIGRPRRPIIVPPHRQHRTVAPPADQGTRIQHIAGMHQNVAAVQHPTQRFRHRTMGVGNQPQPQRTPVRTVIRQLAPIDPFSVHGLGL